MGTFKKIVMVMVVFSMTAFVATSCGKKNEAPAGGADSTMTQTAPDTTGAAATDTTKAK